MSKLTEEELQVKYDALVAQLALETNRDAKGIIVDPVIEGIHLYKWNDRMLAAVYMAYTEQCTAAQGGRLYSGGKKFSLLANLERVGRIMRYWNQVAYNAKCVIHWENTAEVAKAARASGFLTSDDAFVKNDLDAAILDPDNWVVTMETHPDDGCRGIAVVSVKAPYDLLLDRWKKPCHYSTKLQMKTDELVVEKRDANMLRWMLEPIRTQ